MCVCVCGRGGGGGGYLTYVWVSLGAHMLTKPVVEEPIDVRFHADVMKQKRDKMEGVFNFMHYHGFYIPSHLNQQVSDNLLCILIIYRFEA